MEYSYLLMVLRHLLRSDCACAMILAPVFCCNPQLSSAFQEPPTQLCMVCTIVPVEESLFSRFDYVFGDVHRGRDSLEFRRGVEALWVDLIALTSIGRRP